MYIVRYSKFRRIKGLAGFFSQGTLYAMLCISIIMMTMLYVPSSNGNFKKWLPRLRVIDWYIRTTMGTNNVCRTSRGRLGNQMFEYASLYGIARHHNFTINLTEGDDLLQYFSIRNTTVQIVSNRVLCFIFETVLEKHGCCTYDETLMNLPVGGNYIIGEWLQSWKYFKHVLPEIRQQFIFRSDIKNIARNIVDNIRNSTNDKVTVVGVHLRVGDIMHDESLRQHGFQIVPDSYVHKAINYMLRRLDNVVFIVCSDNIKFAEEVIGDGDIDAYYFAVSPVQDMAILAECDHMIMTVGTFGWWAGFLTGGTVVYYKHPYREGSDIWRAHTKDDYYLPAWIGLE